MTAYTARCLPVHHGKAAWNAILGPQTTFPELADERTADFVVIGAGFAGLTAAHRLTQLQPDARITVLEASQIAEGAAGRNSGFMIDLPHDLASEDYAGSGDDRALIALNRQAISFGRDIVETYGIDRSFFDEVGKINGAVSDRAHGQNLSYTNHLNALGEASEMLDKQQMQEITGSVYYRSGLYTPGTVMLQPAGYIRGLAAGLARRGVVIHERSPAVAFSQNGNDWRVQTPNGSVTTGRVILSVNGHLESFGFAKGRLMQLFLFASMTNEIDTAALQRLGGHPRWGITPSDPMGTTMRRIDSAQGGNRIVTRTCAVLRPDMAPRSADMIRTAKTHRRKFDLRFPQLAGTPMQYSWAGHLCLSLNGVSVTGEIERGVFSACVQNGLGTARGTLTGIAAAELACGSESDITRHFAGQEQPRKLPPQPFQQIGANALLRWKEWRATDE